MLRSHFLAIEKIFSSDFSGKALIKPFTQQSQQSKFISKFTSTSSDIKDVLTLSYLNDM